MPWGAVEIENFDTADTQYIKTLDVVIITDWDRNHPHTVGITKQQFFSIVKNHDDRIKKMYEYLKNNYECIDCGQMVAVGETCPICRNV